MDKYQENHVNIHKIKMLKDKNLQNKQIKLKMIYKQNLNGDSEVIRLEDSEVSSSKFGWRRKKKKRRNSL